MNYSIIYEIYLREESYVKIGVFLSHISLSSLLILTEKTSSRDTKNILIYIF